MSTVRLLVLGTLSQQGPMHGHQMRKTIELIDLEVWSEVRAGSLYHALHKLVAEGLIEPVQTEQPGRQPARTVYRITASGEAELAVLRDRVLRNVRLPADPFDVALWVAAGLPAPELERAVRERLDVLRLDLERLVTELRELIATGLLPDVGAILMRHGVIRLEAEVRWHAELLAALPALSSDARSSQQQDSSNLTTQN